MKKPESNLLERVKSSDKKAFQELFYNFHDNLFRFVFYKVKDSDLAEDITQETFLRVWKKRGTLKPEKSFFSLIARISTNLCYDHFRHVEVRQRNEEKVPEFGKSHFDDPESVLHGNILQEKIQTVVNNRLPEKCREVFHLSRIEGYSNPEIAKKLNLSIRTVENQIYRALKVLKRHLNDYL